MKFETLSDINATLEMLKINKNNKNQKMWFLKNESFKELSPCYLYSNENLRAYYPYFPIKDNNVLTVCGSGDQVLSSILYGAKKVDVFDSNKLAFYNLILKKAAIKALTLEEFINFYEINSLQSKRLIYFKKILEKIDDTEIQLFFDKIFNDNVDDFEFLFFGSAGSKQVIIKRIPFLDYQNYNLLKKQLDDVEINFKNINILNIVHQFNDRYSFINLSNILDYIKDECMFMEFAKELMDNNLNDQGQILLNYHWSIIKPYHKLNSLYENLNAKTIVISDLAIDNSSEPGMIKILKK